MLTLISVVLLSNLQNLKRKQTMDVNNNKSSLEENSVVCYVI